MFAKAFWLAALAALLGSSAAAQTHPVYVSGRVVLDSGEPPPEPALIERICSGQKRPMGYTDPKGRFQFEAGGEATAGVSDASLGGRGPESRFAGAGADLAGCEVRASLPGFQSDGAPLGRRRAFENIDLGTIVLRSLDGVRRSSIISVTSLEAPKPARDAYDSAVQELGRKRGDRAKVLAELEKAVALYPNYAVAWSVLGSVRLQAGDVDGAEEALERAVQADPDYVRPYPDLIRIQVGKQDWERTAALSDKLLALHPGRTQARFFRAVADFSRGDFVSAEGAATAVQRAPDAAQFPQTHQILGAIWAKQGRFQEAAGEYRRYLELSPEASSAEGIRRQLAEWEELGVVEGR